MVGTVTGSPFLLHLFVIDTESVQQLTLGMSRVFYHNKTLSIEVLMT